MHSEESYWGPVLTRQCGPGAEKVAHTEPGTAPLAMAVTVQFSATPAFQGPLPSLASTNLLCQDAGL